MRSFTAAASCHLQSSCGKPADSLRCICNPNGHACRFPPLADVRGAEAELPMGTVPAGLDEASLCPLTPFSLGAASSYSLCSGARVLHV